MLANDAALAKTMLQNAQTQGYGSTPMFVGKTWSGGARRRPRSAPCWPTPT
jgi:hypothetical protein